MKLENKIPKEFYFRKTKMVCNTLKFAQNLFVIHQYLVINHHVTAGFNFKSSTKIIPGSKVIGSQHLVHKLKFLEQAPNSNPAQWPQS